ncbi:MAG: hypothetical protein Q7I89_07675 [Syntrophales bacterium]|nr:hypothetical protein [Syntrophales bacterium]
MKTQAILISVTASPAVDAKSVESQTACCYTITAVSASGNESAKSTHVCTATP